MPREAGDSPQPARSRSDSQDPTDIGFAPRRIQEELNLDELISDSEMWEPRIPSARRKSVVIDAPTRRSELAFIRDVPRQSVGKVHRKPEPIQDLDNSTEDQESRELKSQDGTIIIDGRALTLSQIGKPEVNFTPVRLWDEEERASLPADV